MLGLLSAQEAAALIDRQASFTEPRSYGMLAQRAQEYLQTEDAKQESIYPVQKAVGHTHIVVLVCAGTRRQPLGRLSLQFKARLVSIMPLSSRMAALQQRKQVLATLKVLQDLMGLLLGHWCFLGCHHTCCSVHLRQPIYCNLRRSPVPFQFCGGVLGLTTSCYQPPVRP